MSHSHLMLPIPTNKVNPIINQIFEYLDFKINLFYKTFITEIYNHHITKIDPIQRYEYDTKYKIIKFKRSYDEYIKKINNKQMLTKQNYLNLNMDILRNIEFIDCIKITLDIIFQDNHLLVMEKNTEITTKINKLANKIDRYIVLYHSIESQ